MRAKDITRLLPAAVTALLLTSHQAWADYGALMEEMAGYQPPAVVVEQMEAPAPPDVAIPSGDDAFLKQIATLKAEQAKGAQALATPPATASFIALDPALLASLQAAADHDEAAAKALADGFTRETLDALVLLRSPEIKAKESEYLAVLEGYSQVEELDTILRRYSSFTKSVMTGVGGMTNPDPAALKFPFPGVLALKGEVVGQEAAAALQGVEQTRREVVTAARRELAELRYLRRAMEVTHAQLELIDSLNATVATRYEAGNATFAELTAIGSEREKLHETLTTLAESGKNSEAAIRAALLLPETVPIGRPAAEPLPLDTGALDALYALALERRQEILIQQAMIAKAERMLELAETMVYPGFSQGLSLFEGDLVSGVKGEGLAEAAGMTDSQGGSALATPAGSGGGLPKMPWYGSDDAYLRQLRQRLISLNQTLAATRAATRLGVRKAWFSVDRAKREEALYRQRVVPLVRANLDSATQGYSAGQVAFADLVTSANAWLSENLALARSEADLYQARADLDAAVGTSQRIRRRP